MAAYICKKCGSTQTKRNGHDTAGRQKYHCKSCGIYTTTDDAARERAVKRDLIDKLQLERVSQRAIARISGVSRSTIIKRLKKSLSPLKSDNHAIKAASYT